MACAPSCCAWAASVRASARQLEPMWMTRPSAVPLVTALQRSASWRRFVERQRVALAGAAGDEDRGDLVLQQMRGLLLDDREIERAIALERRVGGGDESGEVLDIFHGLDSVAGFPGRYGVEEQNQDGAEQCDGGGDGERKGERDARIAPSTEHDGPRRRRRRC